MFKLISSNLFLARRIVKDLKLTTLRTMTNEQEMVEGVVCKESDVPENGMKEFPLEDGKVLLVKQKGQLYAVGPKCSHYGAPLANGALGDGRIRCPWHGACFSIKTGDIEDCPGLDSLPCYKVDVQSNGDVKISGIKSTLKTSKRMKSMARLNLKTQETYVIIGGGSAGSSCAETLRQEGFTGRIIVLSEENYLPYDRVKCSKQLDTKIDNILLRDKEFYDTHDIEMLLGEKAKKLDTDKKIIETESGASYNYDRVFISVGVRARLPRNLPNFNLDNIFTIRNINDSGRILSKLTPETRVVVIGSSFIGMEAAAFCIGKVKSVTILGSSKVPFEHVLGKEVGQRIGEFFESKGVQIINEANVERFEGTDNKLTHVHFNGDRNLPADICILGIGSIYDTGFLPPSVNLTNHGAIEVNEFLQTSVPNIYAGGDVASAPVHGTDNVKASIGHWQLAQIHGKIAARNMVGVNEPVKSVPFFFSMLFGMGLRYAGYGAGYEEAFTVGDLQSLKFVTYYLKNNCVVAAASIASDPIVAKFAEMLHNGKKLTKNDIIENKWLKTYAI